VKSLAFVIGLCIVAVGAIGIVAPSALIWFAERFSAPVDWYAVSAFRAAFGVLLLVVAKDSRAPRALRVVAFVPLLAALSMPFVGVERARAIVDRWALQGAGIVRLTVIPVLALGGFVAYACAPARRGDQRP
jgi:hypothetical protein